MKKDPKKVAAGKLGAAKRWAADGGARPRRQTVMSRILEEDAEFLDGLDFPSRVEAAHAVVEFYRAGHAVRAAGSRGRRPAAALSGRQNT